MDPPCSQSVVDHIQAPCRMNIDQGHVVSVRSTALATDGGYFKALSPFAKSAEHLYMGGKVRFHFNATPL